MQSCVSDHRSPTVPRLDTIRVHQTAIGWLAGWLVAGWLAGWLIHCMAGGLACHWWAWLAWLTGLQARSRHADGSRH